MSYIKLDRKLLEWGWKDTPEMVALWVDILMEANWTPSEWHGVVYEEGTFPTSVEKLSINTGLSVRTVRTCLERLKKSGEIDIQTTNKGTKIIVNKWALYQGSCDEGDKPNDKPSDKQPTNVRQTADKQSTTLKEYKEVKNKRNIYNRPSLEEVVAYCNERHNGVDPQRWYNYYESNGWKVGRNPMKDWKACVRTWERNTNVRTAEQDTLPTYDGTHNKVMSAEDEEEILRLMGRA